MEHRSLIKPRTEPPTKPLVDTKEIEEMARQTVLKEVETQINQITHDQTVLEKIQQSLDTIQSTLTELQTKNSESSTLKLEVLQKLKNKLANNP